GAGVDPERLAHLLSRAEREAPAGAEPAMQPFELDLGILERRDQIERAALVLEKKILGVAARDLTAQALALLDREQRRMAHGRVADSQPVEKGEQVIGAGRHGRGVALGKGKLLLRSAALTCQSRSNRIAYDFPESVAKAIV